VNLENPLTSLDDIFSKKNLGNALQWLKTHWYYTLTIIGCTFLLCILLKVLPLFLYCKQHVRSCKYFYFLIFLAYKCTLIGLIFLQLLKVKPASLIQVTYRRSAPMQKYMQHISQTLRRVSKPSNQYQHHQLPGTPHTEEDRKLGELVSFSIMFYLTVCPRGIPQDDIGCWKE